MCIDQTNTSKADVEILQAVVEQLGEDSPLRLMLTGICEVVTAGNTVHVAFAVEDPNAPAMPPPPAQEEGVRPGIYSPSRPQPDVPGDGYGQYL